ncbi:MoaD/ThiS family protein [Sporomusa sp.]|uniref:MoaD/ThiS family protein n=1 Tax=Sporomusa sp. TaxID=2078658 RepID=UPI002D0543A3|nr:MoaD/ThiS family protein [Sporomusa sp.]HWR45691.1 MoaD/ThiS family protein [Sporomusa sp.]
MNGKVSVQLQFLGSFRDLAGKKHDIVEVDADVTKALLEIEQMLGFHCSNRISETEGIFINGRHVCFFIEQNKPLKDGDTITFLHLVGGG